MSDSYTTGYQNIVEKIEREWLESTNKKIEKLSREIDFDLLEVLPDTLRNNILNNRSDDPDHKLELKTYPPSKSGNQYEVVCSNDVFKATKKITKKEKDEVLDILHGLSQEPTGSALPMPHHVKSVGNTNEHLRRKFSLSKKTGEGKILIYQYKCGRGRSKRCLWTKREDKVVILFYGTRDRAVKLW